MADEDPYELSRFVEAQRGVYEQAVEELRGGRKHNHWMWFVFPQIAGLGRSPTAQRYAISSLAEADAYLEHHMLGPRLVGCATLLLRLHGLTAEEIFGGIDAIKLRSSMTLFARAAPSVTVFHEVLERYFGGRLDAATEEILGA